MTRYVKVLTSDQSTPKVAGVPAEWTDVESLGLRGGPSYLSYVALLTQTGTNDPVATVWENTLGDTVVWSRIGPGDYQGTLAGAFPADKTFMTATSRFEQIICSVNTANGDYVEYYTETINFDDLLFEPVDNRAVFIEIRVYP